MQTAIGRQQAQTSAATLANTFSQLVKLRINALVVASAWCGAHLAAMKSGPLASALLFHALAGIGLVAAGTAALNQVVERDVDARMERTRRRPLVTGTLRVGHALLLAVALIAGGTAWLALATNWLAALLTFLTSVIYIGAYTPLKKRGPICTTIGAIPGAMPPVLGWAAVRGRLDWGALVLFALLFFWQFPHFYSIAVLYREDYGRAGIRMLPVVERDGSKTALQVLLFSLALVGVTLLPWLLQMAGWKYMASALLLGAGFIGVALIMWRSQLPEQPLPKAPARLMLKASVIYLPLLLGSMVVDCL
jgi:protoheme IX farnesyltransferase